MKFVSLKGGKTRNDRILGNVKEDEKEKESGASLLKTLQDTLNYSPVPLD